VVERDAREGLDDETRGHGCAGPGDEDGARARAADAIE
jgi:hypothetical protein